MFIIRLTSILRSQGAKAAYSRENSLRHEDDTKINAASSSS